jgi:hypothetical protein
LKTNERLCELKRSLDSCKDDLSAYSSYIYTIKGFLKLGMLDRVAEGIQLIMNGLEELQHEMYAIQETVKGNTEPL